MSDGATRPFGERLLAAMNTRGPLCVGIDPHRSLMSDWGLADDPSGLERFARGVVEAIGESVAVVKPQAAFFERHGAAGIAVLERVVADAKSAGTLVVFDGKRGDIGSTVEAYADAYLDPRSPLCADAMTAHPYLGVGALRPLLDRARDYGNGVFVVTRSSNPEAGEVQAATVAGSRTVAGTILDRIAEANIDALTGEVGLGSVGAVVGATTWDTDEDYGRFRGPILAPGLGAQGGTPADLRRIFRDASPYVLPNASRSILTTGPTPQRLAAATKQTIEECLAALR